MNKYALLTCLTLVSAPCLADFDFVGKGTTQSADGQQSAFTFGFGWQQAKGQLRIGKKTYDMDSLPESYSLALVLSKDEQQVWLQEFHAGWFESFYWELGEHVIRLDKRNFEQPVKGDYELNIDGRSFFLNNNNVAIKIHFSEDGVDKITASGVSKNMGTKD